MPFNRFYFLHIPKTGGRYVFANVIATLNLSLNQYGVPRVDEPYAHTGWHKDIDENTYIMCLFRDPVDQIVSLYSHAKVLDHRGHRKFPVGEKKLTKDGLFNWINRDLEGSRNFQSKNLLVTRDIKERISDIEVTSTDQVLERLNRINLFMRTELLNNFEFNVIVDKIVDDLGLPKIENYMSYPTNGLKNPDSLSLRESLTEDDANYLRSLSKVDDDIYKNDSLFWSPK